MEDQDIIVKWKQGLSKEQLAKIYKRQYNQNIKIIRAEVRNRHSGRFITNYEALEQVERVIYNYLKRKWEDEIITFNWKAHEQIYSSW